MWGDVVWNKIFGLLVHCVLESWIILPMQRSRYLLMQNLVLYGGGEGPPPALDFKWKLESLWVRNTWEVARGTVDSIQVFELSIYPNKLALNVSTLSSLRGVLPRSLRRLIVCLWRVEFFILFKVTLYSEQNLACHSRGERLELESFEQTFLRPCFLSGK